MKLQWTEVKGKYPLEGSADPASEESFGDKRTHYCEVMPSGEYSVKAAVEEATDKSISLLARNIRDDSLFLLFEWDTKHTLLTIVVTDDSKTKDAPESVSCLFSSQDRAGPEINTDEFSEKLREWIRDYLTTSTGFMNFSLVAAFHSGERTSTVLL